MKGRTKTLGMEEARKEVSEGVGCGDRLVSGAEPVCKSPVLNDRDRAVQGFMPSQQAAESASQFYAPQAVCLLAALRATEPSLRPRHAVPPLGTVFAL